MPSGALASLHIKKEATFKTDPTVGSAVIGHGAKITSLERNNNIERIWGLGSRAQTVSLEKQFSGTVSTEHILSNPWFFSCVIGSGSTTGVGPYVHTFSEASTLNSYAIKNSIELGTPDAELLLSGCVNNSTTITANINEPASVKMDWIYATETLPTSATYTPQTEETFDVFGLASGTLEFPSGTVIANVQNCEASINNNVEIIYGLGSRVGSTKVEKNREYGVRASVYMTDPTSLWRYLYNGTSSGTTPNTASITETATLNLIFNKGASKIIKLAFTNVKIDTHSLPQDPTAPIIEELSLIPRGLSVIATNSTSAIPADW